MENSGSRKQPNLYLIGFMGVGKSVLGRGLARRLRMRFLDSDHEIERAAGKSIASIFAEEGEAAFRAKEREFVDGGHPESGCVVSCGGGLPIQPGMGDLLLARGVVVCLFARAETIVERTVGNPKRPLLNVADPEARVRELLSEREPVYLQLGIGVSTDGRSIPEVLDNLVRIYHREEAARKRR